MELKKMNFDPSTELGPGMGGPLDNVNDGLEGIAKDNRGIGNNRVLSDGTVLKENQNEFIQQTAVTDDFEEHITVPKDDLDDAHWTARQNGNETLGHEPLDF